MILGWDSEAVLCFQIVIGPTYFSLVMSLLTVFDESSLFICFLNPLSPLWGCWSLSQLLLGEAVVHPWQVATWLLGHTITYTHLHLGTTYNYQSTFEACFWTQIKHTKRSQPGFKPGRWELSTTPQCSLTKGKWMFSEWINK